MERSHAHTSTATFPTTPDLSSTDDRLDRAGRLVGYANGTRYGARGEFLFAGVPLDGASVLEVGCGTGAWALWAALHGARQVIGIEPEAAGSTSNTLVTFRRNIETLGLKDQVSARNCFLHQLPAQRRPFDVVVMFNVINHLDEDAVVVMHRDQAAFERFVSALKDLRGRVRRGAWIIVADCTRENFWPRLGMRSPLAPNIDWEKHQDPQTWSRAFEQAGFERVDLRWSPLQPFLRATSNKFVQYFTASHFVLRFRAT
jgi:SAM-dependent methyltransferase